MNIFLTGQNGFLGREFVAQATAAGHMLEYLKDALPSIGVVKPIDWGAFDAVVHLAVAGVNFTDPDRSWSPCVLVNHLGTMALLEAIHASGAAPLIFIPGSIRELETLETPRYWADPYIVTKKLSGMYVIEFAGRYRGRVLRPIIGRCKGPGELAPVVAGILESITWTTEPQRS